MKNVDARESNRSRHIQRNWGIRFFFAIACLVLAGAATWLFRAPKPTSCPGDAISIQVFFDYSKNNTRSPGAKSNWLKESEALSRQLARCDSVTVRSIAEKGSGTEAELTPMPTCDPGDPRGGEN